MPSLTRSWTLVLASLACSPVVLAAPEAAAPALQPAELYLFLGVGSAVCDNEKPDSDCPVDGGGAFGLGGGYRFHDHFSIGAELAGWSFNVREQWRGQLEDPATDVTFSSVHISPLARWYWFDPGTANPYLQAGIGYGVVTARAENAGGSYELTATGITYSLGIGVEWQISELFRLGPQFASTLHVSTKLCEESNGARACRSPSKNEDGDREGLVLPWRLVAVGTFTFGN